MGTLKNRVIIKMGLEKRKEIAFFAGSCPAMATSEN
jgi:hypothetical protein